MIVRRWGLALLLAGAAVLSPALAGPAAAATGTASADAGAASVGQLVHLRGAGWGQPGSTVVTVMVCGNAALSQVDCDLSNTAEGAIRQGGSFFAAIDISAPPAPCPCVLRIATPGSTDPLLLPITIPGLPVAPLQPFVGPQRKVAIGDVSVRGNGPWTSWFGASAKRTLVFSVANTGDVALHDPVVDVTIGRGANPDGFVTPPKLGDLAPGQTKQVEVPIRLSAPSMGSYTASVRIDPVGLVTIGGAKTKTMPWGLALVAIAVLLLVACWLYRRVRRKRITAPAPVLRHVETTPDVPTGIAAASATSPSAALGQLDDLSSVDTLEYWVPELYSLPSSRKAALDQLESLDAMQYWSAPAKTKTKTKTKLERRLALAARREGS